MRAVQQLAKTGRAEAAAWPAHHHLLHPLPAPSPPSTPCSFSAIYHVKYPPLLYISHSLTFSRPPLSKHRHIVIQSAACHLLRGGEGGGRKGPPGSLGGGCIYIEAGRAGGLPGACPILSLSRWNLENSLRHSGTHIESIATHWDEKYEQQHTGKNNMSSNTLGRTLREAIHWDAH